MLEWDTTVHAPAATEDEAAFRARVTTEGEFMTSYPEDDIGGEGADVYSREGCVYISRRDDPDDDEHAVMLSCAQMNRLARD